MQVDLWIWDLDAQDSAALLGMLSEAERGRAARYASPTHARRFIAARGRLREVMARYLGGAPAAVQFELDAQGKPFAPEAGLHFNFSDSGALGALGVCREMALGVDIEMMRARDTQKLAARFFAPAECAALLALPEAEREAAFFRVWTRKEAFLKAVGSGLRTPLSAFEVTIGAEARFTRIDAAIDADVGAWSLHPFAPAANCAGAIALRSAGAPVRVVQREGVR